jgi:hypothetical protein
MQKISNYHDLAVEKQRLQQKIALLKRDVNNEVHEIKRKLRPVTMIASMLGVSQHNNHTTADTPKKDLLKAGAALGIDLLIGRKLATASFMTRAVVPPLLRKISSFFINKLKLKK